MTESKIEKIIREVSFAAQCAEMALHGVKAAAYDSDLLSFPEVQELSEVNYRLDYLSEDLKNLAEKLKVAHMDKRAMLESLAQSIFRDRTFLVRDVGPKFPEYAKELAAVEADLMAVADKLYEIMMRSIDEEGSGDER